MSELRYFFSIKKPEESDQNGIVLVGNECRIRVLASTVRTPDSRNEWLNWCTLLPEKGKGGLIALLIIPKDQQIEPKQYGFFEIIWKEGRHKDGRHYINLDRWFPRKERVAGMDPGGTIRVEIDGTIYVSHEAKGAERLANADTLLRYVYGEIGPEEVKNASSKSPWELEREKLTADMLAAQEQARKTEKKFRDASIRLAEKQAQLKETEILLTKSRELTAEAQERLVATSKDLIEAEKKIQEHEIGWFKRACRAFARQFRGGMGE